MTQKTAYIWGPISSFTGPLAALLLHKDWHVHVATKSALNLFTLAPLDLGSAAAMSIEKVLGSAQQLKTFRDRLRFVEPGEISKATKYDAFIFCGLPPNFDEARVPRAPWAAGELSSISKLFRQVPTFIVSSLWGGVQPDGVVPEELEFERRKPLSHWEGVCQQYENKLLKGLTTLDAPWHLIRLPLLSGSTKDGTGQNFSGLFTLLHELDEQAQKPGRGRILQLAYRPNSTLWFQPVDVAVYMFWRLLEDQTRPRICNLVSTQSTLNREWLQALAQALGYEDSEAHTADSHNLPGILRKLLKDDMLVKTRNLFEVAARYHQLPSKLDVRYFEQLLQFGRAEHWGKFIPSEEDNHSITFTPQLAQTYFKDFLPRRFKNHDLEEATSGGTSIGFYIEGPDQSPWILKMANGKAQVDLLDAENDHPAVKLHLSSETMTRLIQNKVSFHQALIMLQVRMEGRVLDTLRVGRVFSRFLRSNPYLPPQSENPA